MPIVKRNHFPDIKDRAIDDGVKVYCRTERVDEDYFRFCTGQMKRKALGAGDMKKSLRIKYVAVVFACVFLDIVLHVVTASYSTVPENANFSFLSGILGTELTASLWALLAFSGVAFVYLNIRNEIPGKDVKKGLRYGTSIALLWLCAMLEGVSLFGNPMINEFVVGLSDAIPVFVLGILLSTIQFEIVQGNHPAAFVSGEKIKAVLLFTCIFLAGRYVAYFPGVIRSGIRIRPLEILLWTFLMGISIGIAFVLIGGSRDERPSVYRAVKFGFLIFGLNWAVFLIFMPFMFSGYIADVLLRIIIDSTLVTISSYMTIIPGGRFIRKTESIKT